jgi:hypothetical protein
LNLARPPPRDVAETGIARCLPAELGGVHDVKQHRSAIGDRRFDRVENGLIEIRPRRDLRAAVMQRQRHAVAG